LRYGLFLSKGNMIDLHLHTTYSDGESSPKILLEKVVAKGCEIFSVTDHDDIRANFKIIAELKKNNYKIKFITGTEISAVFEKRNFHLLCYNFILDDKNIKGLFEEAAQLRKKSFCFNCAFAKET